MLLALLAAHLLASPFAPPPPAQAAATDALISGRVVDAASHAPVAGAQMTLLSMSRPAAPGPLLRRQATTDANGQFVFADVPPGRYGLDARKAGYAPALKTEMLDVAAGQPIAALEIVLKKGGAITGTIVDANGEPVSDVMVSAQLKDTGGRGPGFAMVTEPSRTNDIGEFRIASLADGEYVVRAAPAPQPPFGQASPATGGTALAPTYYFGTTERDAAQLIVITGGQTVSGIQFSMISAPAHRVSGVVVDENGTPLAGAMVTLIGDPRGGGPVMPARGQSNQDGTFQIEGVLSGTYRAMATVPTTWSAGGVTGGTVGFGADRSLAVTVKDSDVTGLTVVAPARR